MAARDEGERNSESADCLGNAVIYSAQITPAPPPEHLPPDQASEMPPFISSRDF
jgi:hypothetical protein